MKKNRKRNYTLYWMAGISIVLTIPVCVIIIRRVQAGNLTKTFMIMAVFLILLIAIMILYRNIFGVTMQEITQEDKVTPLGRQSYELSEFSRKYRNPQIRKCIEMVIEQIKQFQRRKDVLLQVAASQFDSNDSGTMDDLVQTVEDAIVVNIERLINRVEIFDDQGMPEVIRQNIGYIEELIQKDNEILMEFETLITETSRMGEVCEEKDISKLRDVVNAMQSLRSDQEDEINELSRKYENKEKENHEQRKYN